VNPTSVVIVFVELAWKARKTVKSEEATRVQEHPTHTNHPLAYAEILQP
jgi:hypothetical protein